MLQLHVPPLPSRRPAQELPSSRPVTHASGGDRPLTRSSSVPPPSTPNASGLLAPPHPTHSARTCRVSCPCQPPLLRCLWRHAMIRQLRPATCHFARTSITVAAARSNRSFLHAQAMRTTTDSKPPSGRVVRGASPAEAASPGWPPASLTPSQSCPPSLLLTQRLGPKSCSSTPRAQGQGGTRVRPQCRTRVKRRDSLGSASALTSVPSDAMRTLMLMARSTAVKAAAETPD